MNLVRAGARTHRVIVGINPCVYRKLNPKVLMMKPAQDGVRNLAAAENSAYLCLETHVSEAVIIVRIGSQDSAQMCLAQNNDVIQTRAPNRSDQPFGKAILPG
jgi:hypothetical protein